MRRLGKGQLSIIMEGNVGKVMKGGKLLERVRFEKGDNLVEAVEKLKKEYLLEGFEPVQGIPYDTLVDMLYNEASDVLKFGTKITYLAEYRDWETDRKSTRLNSSHRSLSRMPSSA